MESVSFAEGGPSDDILLAGKGDDTLIGGQGDDFLKGGQGDDSFIYNTGDGSGVVFGGQGDDNLHFGDVTIEEFSENWQVLDSDGNEVDLKEITVDGKIDLSSIDGNGTVVGPDGSEITVKSLETLSFEEAEIVPPTTSPSPIDGLVHDGKITVTLGGESFKGDPAYAIVVDGKEVARGEEVDWAKDTEGAEKLYGNGREKMMSIIRKSNGGVCLIMISHKACPKVGSKFLMTLGGHDPKMNGRIATSSLIRFRLMDFRSNRKVTSQNMPIVKGWNACHGKALLISIWIKPTHRTWRITNP